MYRHYRLTVGTEPQQLDLGDDRSTKGLRVGIQLIDTGTIFLGGADVTTESGDAPGYPVDDAWEDNPELASDAPWLVADSDIEIVVLIGGGS